MNRKIRKRIKELSIQHNVPESVVQKAWESQFRIVKEVNRGLDLNHMTEERFKDLKTNFNWKYIGKLFIDFKNLKRKQEKWEKVKK